VALALVRAVRVVLAAVVLGQVQAEQVEPLIQAAAVAAEMRLRIQAATAAAALSS
jgi:hypothetical protein